MLDLSRRVHLGLRVFGGCDIHVFEGDAIVTAGCGDLCA